MYCLHRLPTSFYVSVQLDGKTMKTNQKPVFVDEDEVEWCMKILLSSERSSVISLTVYAAFELGPMLGSGELLHQFKITVGDVLDRIQQARSLEFLIQEDDVFPAYPSLRIIVERRICDTNDTTRGPDIVLESDTASELEQQTDAGHFALLRYHQLQNQSDLDEAVTCFGRVRDMCTPDHPKRSAALFNLAMSKFIQNQATAYPLDLDMAIALYHDALLHRAINHPDHCATALHLCFALLARFQRQRNESDISEVQELLRRVVERCSVKSYTYRAARLALRMAEIALSTHATDYGTSQAPQTNHDDANSVQATWTTLLDLSDDDSRRLEILGALGSSFYSRFEGEGDISHLHEAILSLEHAVRIAPDGYPRRPAFCYLLGKSLSRRFERLHDLADIDRSILMFEEAVRLIPNSDPNRLVWVKEFGNVVSRRIECHTDTVHVVKSTWIAKEALRLAPEGHPDRPVWLSDLGRSSFQLFQSHFGKPADIHEAVSSLEEAVNLTPNGHPNKSERLNNLATALLHRFDHLGNSADIDKAISTFDEALHHTPKDHPRRPALLIGLTNSLYRRFHRHSDDIADIDRSILMIAEAVDLAPLGHPDKPARSSTLGNLLLLRFERFSNPTDLDASVSMGEKAVQLTPNADPDRPARLNSVASSLMRRFEFCGDLEDIQRAISMFEDAIDLEPAQSPDTSIWLHNLGNALLFRFDGLGNFEDLEKAISVAGKALQLTPDSDPRRPSRLSNLGSSLLRHFEHIGNLADIDKSILLCDEAVRLTPDSNPGKPARLVNLGNSLYCRFQRLGDPADIDKSILVKEKALHLAPDEHPDMPSWLSDLGSSLLSRFELTRNIADLHMSIAVKEKAVDLAPASHPEKPIWLDNLGNSLLTRFQYLGDLSDINKSIMLKEEAVKLLPKSHPHRPAMLNNLASSYLNRFGFVGDLADVNKSISVQEETMSLTPDGHPDKSIWLRNLGNSFKMSFEHSGNPSDLSAAILHFSAASCAPTGSISARFFAARDWISSAYVEGNSHAILSAYTTAISLLPQLAWLGIPVTERHRVLLDAADIARDAAAAALEVGDVEKAVEWLEEGRSIVWNQFLQLRTPTDELRAAGHPTLADQFQQISQELEDMSSRGNNMDPGKAQSLEKDVKEHHDLALQRENVLQEIRSLPGFKQFLLPKGINQLSALVNSGPVVYLNASKQRCDALIITGKPGHVVSVPLTGFSYKDGERLFRLLLGRDYPAVSRDGISALISSEFDPDSLALQQFLETLIEDHREGALKTEGYTPNDRLGWILSFLWHRVVNPVLQALGFSSPPSCTQKLTRIFWCPTGPFAFLPIHAAGRYGRALEGAKLSDFVISSYIPTLSTLTPTTKKASNEPSSKICLVAVPQPPKDGQIKLKCVKEEIDYIRMLSTKFQHVTLEESHGTVEDVMEKMTNANWVHFACHGVQDPKNPLDSGLCLADERRLKLSDIIRLSRPQGGLAFLSACQTARGDEKLSEESVHLAAGMLLAGYGGVIATMWSIMDRDAPKVARDVYERLFRDGKVPDSMEAAEALHYAVQYLRNSRAPFTSWVPFIHVGR